MYWIIKCNDRYIAPPQKDYWNAEWTTWTDKIENARKFNYKDSISIARKIDYGCLEIIRFDSLPLE